MSKKSVQNQPVMLNDKYQLFVDLSKGLDEPSPVTLLLVEQVADALYWARQHAIDKELIIINGMQAAISRAESDWRDHSFVDLKDALDQGIGSKAYSNLEAQLISRVGLTIEDLRARSISKQIKLISQVDDLIQRQVRNIRSLQKCIDSVDFKKRIVKKMDLELERLEADVSTLPNTRV